MTDTPRKKDRQTYLAFGYSLLHLALNKLPLYDGFLLALSSPHAIVRSDKHLPKYSCPFSHFVCFLAHLFHFLAGFFDTQSVVFLVNGL
jgi:hypothetical protein